MKYYYYAIAAAAMVARLALNVPEFNFMAIICLLFAIAPKVEKRIRQFVEYLNESE